MIGGTNLAILYALLAAASWGAADFLGGLHSRRGQPLTVALAATAAGLVLLAPVMVVAGGSPTAADLWWGAAAGVGVGAGVALLYRGLAIGRMALVAPVTAIGAALLPVVFGLATGERPGLLVGSGALLALVAVALVSREHEPQPIVVGEIASDGSPPPPPVARVTRFEPGLVEAAAGGVGFGAFFILLARVGPDAGLWPLVPTRAASVVLLFVIAAASRVDVRPPRRLWWPVLAIGVLDTVASALYLLASRIGLLSLVAVLGSLYPAGTVLLALVVLKEKVTRWQAAGMVLAIGAVGLIAAG